CFPATQILTHLRSCLFSDPCLPDYPACRPAPVGLSAPLPPTPDQPTCLPCFRPFRLPDLPIAVESLSVCLFTRSLLPICPPVGDLCLLTTLCLLIQHLNKLSVCALGSCQTPPLQHEYKSGDKVMKGHIFGNVWGRKIQKEKCCCSK
ncbi:unnamed protein product, partial [Boreogadus saida]